MTKVGTLAAAFLLTSVLGGSAVCAEILIRFI
jgi:hypothetical protein